MRETSFAHLRLISLAQKDTRDNGSATLASLKSLMDQIVAGQVERPVLTHKDRLLRFGAELILSLCEAKNVEIILIQTQ